jgi:hypothetical protein
MPKARAPLDVDRYQDLHRQGLSLRQIAKELGIPESTLRDNLKVRDKARAAQGLPQSDQGPPQEDQGIPEGPPNVDKDPHQGPPQGDQGGRPPHISLGPPQPDQAETAVLAGRATPPPHIGGPEDTLGGPQGTPDVHLSIPPLYVHPGIPDSNEESVVGGEDIADIHQGIPAVPAPGRPQGDQGPPPGGALSPQLVEALTTAWPELQQMLAWWHDRQRLVQDAAAPERQLERQTYHIEKRFIEAVRREADLTGESYAAIVNRAFAQYFAGKST